MVELDVVMSSAAFLFLRFDAQDFLPLLALEVADGVEGDGGADAPSPEFLDVVYDPAFDCARASVSIRG